MRRISLISLLVVGLSAALLFGAVLRKLVADWATDENYSHGFLMVPVVIFVLWRQRKQLAAITERPSILGLLVVAGSVIVLGAGVLGAELFLTRVALLGTLAGTVVFLWGFGHLRAVGFAFLLLLLAIPIPAIIFNQIAFPLQLLASRFGEFALSACQIPVLREGNVIVLASTSLEVAEACSGIRSLVSLVALAVIWGYLSESAMWLRWVLACSAVPIAIFANGIRVAGTGIAADLMGPEAALGFFHGFSGWLVFLVAGVLLLVVYQTARWLAPSRSQHPAAEPPQAERLERPANAGQGVVLRAGVVACCLVGAALGLQALTRTEVTPLREPLESLPLQLGSWAGGNAGRFSRDVEAVLGVDEYLVRGYAAPGRPGVSLYVGYYASQRQGQTMHSPMNCMPGTGWEPTLRRRVALQAPGPAGSPVRAVEVNRLVVQKGLDRLLVLYWYQGHGRIVASEYWGKIYTVVDAIRLNRTDGALVRIIAPIDTRIPGAEQQAEQAALDFASQLLIVLGRYLPD
jgi:exosortase D (VPLPA-CTERM-specific)